MSAGRGPGRVPRATPPDEDRASAGRTGPASAVHKVGGEGVIRFLRGELQAWIAENPRPA